MKFLGIMQGEQEPFENYLSRFYQLSRYSTHSTNEKWLTHRLIRGLVLPMRQRIVPLQLKKMDKAIEVCTVTEMNSPNL